MKDKVKAIHVEVVHAIPGRIRLHFEHKTEYIPTFLPKIAGITEFAWNEILKTAMIRYDQAVVSEEALLEKIAALYAYYAKSTLVHVRFHEDRCRTLTPSAFFALGCIALDGIAGLITSPLKTYTQWLSILSTLGTVFEHGYHELRVRGSFDPEVMSIVYLLNSIGNGNSFQASLIAWVLTFGRHLLPKPEREKAYMIREHEGKLLATGVRSNDRHHAFCTICERSLGMISKSAFAR